MPQDSGPTEYTNQSIVAMAKHILKAQKLEKLLWKEAMANLVYTLNRCLSRVLHSVTLKET